MCETSTLTRVRSVRLRLKQELPYDVFKTRGEGDLSRGGGGLTNLSPTSGESSNSETPPRLEDRSDMHLRWNQLSCRQKLPCSLLHSVKPNNHEKPLFLLNNGCAD